MYERETMDLDKYQVHKNFDHIHDLAKQSDIKTSRPTLILIGDSLTQYAVNTPPPTTDSICSTRSQPQSDTDLSQWGIPDAGIGWGLRLMSRYSTQVDVIFRGFSGYTSQLALELVPQILAEGIHNTKKTLVTLFWGANDAALPGNQQHVPLDIYERNMEMLAVFLINQPGVKVLLITPPPVDGLAFAQTKKEPPNRDLLVTKDYAQACIRIGLRHNLPVLNLFEELLHPKQHLQNSDFWKSLLYDGIHFNDTGQAMVADLLASFIELNFPEFGWTPAFQVFPNWREVCKTAPAK